MFLLNQLAPSRTEWVRGILAVGILISLPPITWGQDGLAIVAALEEGFTQLIEDAEPSVVSIARIQKHLQMEGNQTGENQPPNMEPINPNDFIPSEFGTGVIFEPPDQTGKRYILTMYHVVKGGHVAGRGTVLTDELVIHTHTRQKARVEILAADPRSDLAVLQLRENQAVKPADLVPIRLAKTARYKKGQFVITLGNPYAIARDGSACAGWGMLSNIARQPQPVKVPFNEVEKRKRETIHHMGTLLQIDGQLNLGTSGGAVLNRQGELIGLITAMAAIDGYEKSVGYAVPITKGIKRVITELAHGYEVEYGLLGITPVTKPFPAGKQPTAVYVDAKGVQSPASIAGVVTGDMIYAVNGVTIFTQEDLMREVALIGPGQIAKLQFYRAPADQWITREVTLTKWPVYNDEEIIATKYRHAWNNIAIDYSTARFDFFNQQYRPAVLVAHIHRETPQHLSQLRVGDFITHVDDAPVRSPQEFAAATSGKKSGTVKLRLLDRTVTIRVSE